MLKLFWENVDTGGRDRDDIKVWKSTETVWLADDIAMEDPLYPKSRKNERPGRTLSQYPGCILSLTSCRDTQEADDVN